MIATSRRAFVRVLLAGATAGAASACYPARTVPLAALPERAHVTIAFDSATDLVAAGPAAVDTLRGVRRVDGRLRTVAGDTVVLREVQYADHRGRVRVLPRDAELRYARPADRVGADGVVRHVRFSPTRTLLAVTLPIVVPLALVGLLVAAAP